MIGLAALIIMLYSGVQLLELTAVLARIAGIAENKPMLGLSIQHSVYMGTRLFTVFLLPMLGLLVDAGISLADYRLMSHLSLLGSALLGVWVYFFRNWIVRYYCKIILRYGTSGNLMTAFFSGPILTPEHAVGLYVPDVREVIGCESSKRLFVLALVVFLIYCTGIFLSFYAALIFSEWRTSLSHAAGVFTALGGFILTFVIEPKISSSIDVRDPDAPKMIVSLFLGRLAVLAIFGQLFLALAYWLTHA